jgi:hypothetical protein
MTAGRPVRYNDTQINKLRNLQNGRFREEAGEGILREDGMARGAMGATRIGDRSGKAHLTLATSPTRCWACIYNEGMVCSMRRRATVGRASLLTLTGVVDYDLTDAPIFPANGHIEEEIGCANESPGIRNEVLLRNLSGKLNPNRHSRTPAVGRGLRMATSIATATRCPVHHGGPPSVP